MEKFLSPKTPSDMSSEDTRLPSAPTNKTSENPVMEIIRFALIALIIVIPIRMFIAQPFIVSGASMEDTFMNGQYLIVDQLTYQFEQPERGDVVIFRYPKDPSKYFIKRVIGLPGDTITIENNTVTIANDSNPDGYLLTEPYVEDMNGGEYLVTELGAEEYFVMGDNRNYSSDSRMWGVLPEDKIIGRALLRLFPINSIELFPGFHENETLPAD